MKTRGLISVLTLGLMLNTFGQKPTMELTFMADINEQYVSLDSIFIENLTQGGDTTLYSPDTILSLEYTLGVNEIGLSENSFSISQNYPNPFTDQTTINLNLPDKEKIDITIRDIIGRELVQYENTLNRGQHSFAFYPGNEKYYLLTVTGKQTSKTIKMLNAGSHTTNGEKCKIVYTGNKGNVKGFKSQQAINDFVYSLGDSLQYTGYANSIDGIFGSAVIQHKPQEDTIYVFDILKGLRCPGTPTVTDIEGSTYNTVQIGAQCWMKENLKTTTYQNGTPIPNVTDADAWYNLTTGAYVWYENDISWKDSYGALYNWYATVDANGLCPTGWHIPTTDEWTALTDFIGGTNSPYGNELKSCRQVNSPQGGGCNTTEHPRWNEIGENGTDDYGFSGLPGGGRSSSGIFGGIVNHGIWWSSSEHSSIYARSRILSYNSSYIHMGSNYKQDGFSVRCLRD